jgi:beta-lactam-binding protein with PASTA domain
VRSYFYSLLWLLPFLCFLGGYQLIQLLSDHGSLEAPSVVGQHIHDAIKLLSRYHLNARIVTEKEDADVPEGIVISQSPLPGKKIKSHQSLFLVVTRKPPKPQAPVLYGMTTDDAHAITRAKHIQLKAYAIESINPHNTCIAQSAQPNQELSDNTMTAYFSDGTTPIRVFPQVKGKRVKEVSSFLKEYGIECKITHTKGVEEGHVCSCIIVAQQPLPGTLVNMKRPLIAHLTVDAHTSV